jgi:hypothetical protein
MLSPLAVITEKSSLSEHNDIIYHLQFVTKIPLLLHQMQNLTPYRDNPISVHDSVGQTLAGCGHRRDVFYTLTRVLVMKTCNIKQESFFAMGKFLYQEIGKQLYVENFLEVIQVCNLFLHTRFYWKVPGLLLL